MEVINKIKIDLLKPGVKPIVNVMQADENSRVIEIALYANGVSWEVPDGVSFSVAYKKPDGTRGLYDTLPDGSSASSVDSNVVSIRLAPQMLTAPGTVNASVVISSGDQRISTFPIIVNVIQNPAVGAVGSEDYFYSSEIGNLDDLKTNDKSSLVAAINEIFGTGGGSDSGQNPNGGTGLTSTEKNLMLTLFKAVPYQSDVSATMKSLEAIWSGGSSGGETPDEPDNPDIPDVTYYSVTYNLTSVTADSTPASVVEGGSLTVNLIADTNAVLGEVVVTMGGVDVTATAYSNGKISISSVTGNVVITATATVASYTQVEYLETADKTAYINTGYTLKPTDLIECVFTGATETNWAFPFAGITQNGAMCKFTTRPDGVKGRTSYTRRGSGAYSNSNAADPDFIVPTGNTTVYRFTESAPGTGTIYDVNGNALVTLTDESVSGFTAQGCVMGLFVAFQNGMPYSASGGVVGMRIHSFKITNVYGVAVLDLIPVLDENEVACMYDKVSGEYLYNGSETEGSVFVAGGAV